MILVTGAGGKTGHAVVRELAARNENVRALVRRRGQTLDLQSLGATEIVVQDLLSAVGMERVMERVCALYLIAPNMHSEELRIGEIVLTAARTAGVERVVYHSVLHPQTREMPHHWQKLAMEEKLFESGLDFTVLQPGAYMQNVLSYWGTVVSEGVYRVPYGEGAALSLVDLEDVAAVAARVLTSTAHNGAIYELAGPEALSPSDIAQALSECLGRPVKAETISVSQWTKQARASGMERYPLNALSRMFRYYDQYGLKGNPRVLEWLLERQPTTFRQFVERARPNSAG
jgi:uncharacterized protein YbjT (DUF2867 family)